MVVFIYMIFRIVLLFILNIGWEIEDTYAQQKPVDTVKKTPVDSVTVTVTEKELEAVLDSTLKAVQELREIPKEVNRGTRRNRQLSKKVDRIYYEAIIPLKLISIRPSTQYKITANVSEMPHIRDVTFSNHEICVDSLPYRVRPEEPLKRVKKTFFQKLRSFFRKDR